MRRRHQDNTAALQITVIRQVKIELDCAYHFAPLDPWEKKKNFFHNVKDVIWVEQLKICTLQHLEIYIIGIFS